MWKTEAGHVGGQPLSSPELIKATEGALSHVWSAAIACKDVWRGKTIVTADPLQKYQPPCHQEVCEKRMKMTPYDMLSVLLSIQFISPPNYMFMHRDSLLPYIAQAYPEPACESK